MHLLTLLKSSKTLLELNLAYNSLTDKQLEDLANVFTSETERLPLQVLNLAHNKLTTTGVSILLEALTKSSAGNVQRLILDKSDLEPRNAKGAAIVQTGHD